MSTSTKSLVEFAVKDAKAGSPRAPWRMVVLFYAIALPYVVTYFLGFQPRSEHGHGIRIFAVILLLSILQAVIPFVASRIWLYSAPVRLALTLGFVLAATTPFFRLASGVGFADLWHNSWHAHLGCFIVGFFASALAFVGQYLMIRRWGPMFDAATRLTLAVSAGISGLVALELHCPSYDPAHLLISHLGHAIAIAPLVFLLIRSDTNGRVRKLLR